MLEDKDPPFAPLTGEFADANLERAYRVHYMRESRWLIYVNFTILVLALLTFIINDLRLQEPADISNSLLACRVGLLAICVVLILSYHKLSVRAVDYCLLLVLFGVGAFQLLVESTRPSSYTGHIGLNVMFIETIYLILPIPMRLQLTAALMFTAGELIMFDLYRADAHPLNHLTVPLSLIIANVIGALVASRYARFRRTQFYLMLRERKARAALQEALANIRTLSGLLPICSRCKKVRDDQGYWKSVESYVSDHSDAEFSHGYCPVCLEHELEIIEEFAQTHAQLN